MLCGCGGTGRHKGLKIPRRESCGFKSHQPHFLVGGIPKSGLRGRFAKPLGCAKTRRQGSNPCPSVLTFLFLLFSRAFARFMLT